MKKLILLSLVVLLVSTMMFSLPDGERKRIYLMTGAGYTASRFGGFCGELGVEVRLFGQVHACLLADYNSGSGIENNGETINYAYGLNLYALYKIHLSDTLSLNLKAGGHYTTIDSQVSAFGVTFDSVQASPGAALGVGVVLQFTNKLELYIDTVLKYLLVDEPWSWLKMQMGFRFRIR
ncbi:MAG: hypothetical protein GY940_17835 [bacterium]|nr:hypothetical protein [bacterium]